MAIAALEDSLRGSQALVRAGADVNARSEGGTTPLHSAARSRTPANIQVLLDAGADASLVNNDGETALDIARGNDAIKGTDAYWRLNDLSYN